MGKKIMPFIKFKKEFPSQLANFISCFLGAKVLSSKINKDGIEFDIYLNNSYRVRMNYYSNGTATLHYLQSSEDCPDQAGTWSRVTSGLKVLLTYEVHLKTLPSEKLVKALEVDLETKEFVS